MSLVEYATQELQPMLKSEEPWDRLTASAVVALVELFAKQGHSGLSAATTVHLFARLALFKPLGPLTGADDEWVEVEPGKLWQNTRRSSVFKTPEGAHDIDAVVFEYPDGLRVTRGRSSQETITFPYVVPEQPLVVKVDADGRELQ